jgi:hypothetical protein
MTLDMMSDKASPLCESFSALPAVEAMPRRLGFSPQVEFLFLVDWPRRLFLLANSLLLERHNVVTYLQDSLVNVGM